ncbi:class I SAM-dependent methyltransferase [Nocardia sp. CS682]|uniref:class I SAM-dependent methyltransferase n=1 Tax=Nocardia sp. CS682 TaxID=1047172 RepID=UPI001074D6C6|nr:class I SAM-dependent methyltransferase [Nocardia sp. CS682]QBS38995.1 SAM-dependent methyltransferase [Nocardia sp. CS682]
MGNPFDSAAIAERYVRGRLYYHPQALRIALRQLAIDRAGVAVDVACGTGLSTRAVLDVARRVVACDASVAMVRTAERNPRAQFVTAAAEQLPLKDGIAELATVAAAFHWFDPAQVLAELARVLRRGGGLAVYSDYFHGRLVERPAFAEWMRGEYMSRYPSVRRRPHFDPDAATAAGFGPTTSSDHEWRAPMTCEAAAAYLVSQSNTAAATSEANLPELQHALTEEIRPFFPENGPAEAVFTLRVCTTTLRR